VLLAAFVAFANSGPREMDPRHYPVPEIFRWLAIGWVGAKAVAAGLAVRQLRRRRLLPCTGILLGLGAWAAAASALFAALLWFAALPEGPTLDRFLIGQYLPLFSGALPDELRSPAWLAALAVMFVPLARLLAAPAALDWNRHR
jgi:hypothetical protein